MNDVTTEAAETKKAAAVTEKVKMEDGREVEFAGIKRRMLKDSIFKEDGTLDYVRLDFRNGATRKISIPEDLTFDGKSAIHVFAAHGIEQKYGDELAGFEGDTDDMVLEIDTFNERILAGHWSVKREGSGMAGTSVLIRALVEYSTSKGDPRTIEQVQAYLKPMKPGEKLALRNSPQLKPIVERLEAEKAAKAAKVDTEALLANF